MAENDILPPLHHAARQGDEAVVRELLDASPEAALVQIEGKLPLHYAACYGHEAATRLLVHAYPHTASVTCAAGHTPLHYATLHGKVAIVNLLLDAHPHAAMVKSTETGNLPLALKIRHPEAGPPILQEDGLDICYFVALCDATQPVDGSARARRVCGRAAVAQAL